MKPLSGFFDRIGAFFGLKKKTVNVLMVGLNNSGKTTVVNVLKNDSDKPLDIVPTVGLNVEHFKYQSVSFTTFDMSGQSRYRDLWERYYKDCDGIIFVVDSSDRLRVAVAREELDLLLAHEDIASRSLPLLVLANKMDVRGALSAVKLAVALGLERVRDRPWHVCATNALTGDGLRDGVDWFAQQLCQPTK